ncbi:hypothetical protein M407DRAFT_24356 [Tulasnella calospora MUT 4182]|uniref:Uncharacterized protein n=1 Tax=Tulasnella calospora MUT 4182 TaxID=1051891 RepID=A0A0C3LY90_9AGAM|nr:hypothetical protein M407DRAFT_24356 [Tulasnella calospora MUT 4182]
MSTSRPSFPRNLCIRLSTFSALSVVLFYLIVQPASTPEPFSEPFHHGLEEETVTNGVSSKCSPRDWSAGTWKRKENPVVVVKPDDVYAASGFKGCASNREMPWHLSNGNPQEFAWRGNVSAYDWVPSAVCDDMRDHFEESLVVDLVERGGWLLIGVFFFVSKK